MMQGDEFVRINRYIMECKWIDGVSADFCRDGINRYIMECKLLCKV